jgi:hypothetical protein
VIVSGQLTLRQKRQAVIALTALTAIRGVQIEIKRAHNEWKYRARLAGPAP